MPSHTSHAFNEIPVLDLSWADDQDPKRRAQLLAQLRHALVDVGFLYVVNHGVPGTVVDGMVAILPALFALPDDQKERIALHHSAQFLGYSSEGSETTAGQADRREQVEFATEHPDDWTSDQPVYERLRGPNQWPAGIQRLQPAVQAYLDALTELGERFLRLVAEALALAPDTLLGFLSDQHRLKLVHYPGVAAADVGSRQGVGPHKDSSGWWTFLLQASPPPVGGLQALNREGAWIDVPAIPGSFVVNIGQAFEVVTNGVCPATTHRVLAGAAERFSVPFFQGVRRNLTKAEAVETLREHFREQFPEHCFDAGDNPGGGGGGGGEAAAGRQIDSPFLRGTYDTWGESQLRTKVRSHRDVGARFYGDVFDKYTHDDEGS